MKRILSLGAGVQSTCVLLMSCRGILPKYDAAIFADTGWEPKAVYNHLYWLTKEAEKEAIPVFRVGAGDLREKAIPKLTAGTTGLPHSFSPVPLFVLNDSNSIGMLRRQCTRQFKITPVDNFIRREILKIGYHKHAPKTPQVEVHIGISHDERERQKDSTEKWKKHVFPLCNIGGKFLNSNFTRYDCAAWLKDNYPTRVIPRSACIGCPYRSDKEWLQMQQTDPKSWEDAVEFDREIRQNGSPFFVHRSLKPLGETKLNTDADQFQFGFSNECDGMCGV